MTKMRRIRLLIFLSVIGINFHSGAEDFPQPASLSRNISFWKKVYLEISTLQGYLHDPDEIDLIYVTLDLPQVSAREQNRWLRNEKATIRRKLIECAQKADSSDFCKTLPEKWTSKDMKAAANKIRFQLGQKDRFNAGLRRSGRYLEKIKSVFRDFGVPEDLAYLPHVESSFDYTAHSRVGAAGIWQFMRSTGSLYMQVNYIVDERSDPLIATQAAAKLLKSNYNKLGSWPLAITAYNHGPAGIARLVKKVGSTDITDIILNERSRRFGFASRNFYAQFLTARELASQHEKYVKNLTFESPIEFNTYKLPKYLPAKHIADALGISIEEMKFFNPALRDPVWKGIKLVPKGFTLKVPADKNPTELLAKLEETQGKAQQPASTWHRVARGDSLWAIARFNQAKLDQILSLNNLTLRSRLYPGQIIQLPTETASAEKIPSPPPPPPKEIPAVVETAQDKSAEKSDKSGAIAAVENAPSPSPTPDVPTPLLKFKEQFGEEKPEATPEDTELAELPTKDNPTPKIQDMSSRMADLAVLKDKKMNGATWVQIRVASEEALSLFSEWANKKSATILEANKMTASQMNSGRLMWIPLNPKVTPQEFEMKRYEYHRGIEDDFFANYEVVETKLHVVKRGEQVWNLCVKTYEIPMWLLHRFNEGQDLTELHAGMKLNIPIVRAIN